METTEKVLAPYLAHLEALPFVKGIKVERQPWTQGARPDARIMVKTPTRDYPLLAEAKRTHLTRPLVDGLLARMHAVMKQNWILFAPHIGRHLGRYLREQGANYVDLVGNCHVELGDGYVASIEGRSGGKKLPTEKSIRGPGFQVIFALLAKAELMRSPVRTLAQAAGVGKTAAADMLKRLETEGLIGADRSGRRMLAFQTLLDRWLTGYATVLRPRLLLGQYLTDDPDPQTREKRIERELKGASLWAWGGGTAAMRLVGHYHGPSTVLHLLEPSPTIARQLRAIPSTLGSLILLRAPGPVAFEGAKPFTVHPLLVYTELLVAGDERAREAAHEIRRVFLEHK